MSGPMSPQEVVERCLALATTGGLTVIVDDESAANLRWANSALTTNGVMHDRQVTVIATTDSGSGTAAGVVSRHAADPHDVEALVRAAERSAVGAGPADDAAPLIAGSAAADWADPPATTSAAAFTGAAPGLSRSFARASAEGQLLFGYVEHTVTTTYVGNSAGLALRHVQPSGHISVNGRPQNGSGSAWVGRSFRSPAELDIDALDAELNRRLGWAARSVELPAGRYDTVLPPAAVADLMVLAYFGMGARDAHEGRSVYTAGGGGTRVGDQLTDQPVTLWSDPAEPGLESTPAVIARASSAVQSTFDTGTPLPRTTWISGGRLEALLQTRRTATLTGLPATHGVDNLLMSVDGGTGDTLDLVADVQHGLLLTCLWYIRDVDPQRLLVTGLTRDGVYEVRDGEITGAVNNFRFNESPVELLGRFTHAGERTAAFGRELGEYFPRTSMPALRVPDFTMSSVSQAS